jgi:lipoprotein-anchoring transpeptidase ErfK/SrfK
VAFVTAVPSFSALAEPSKSPANGAPTTTDTPSGTTTFFGAAKEAVPVVAKKEPAVKPRPLPPTLTASVDLSRQTMTVSVNGDARYRWRISSGTSRYPTPTGNFSPQWTSKMWYSKKYDNSPMPSAVFINGGVAVHGTYHTAALGSPASHGCIRLSPANAKTFYSLVQRHGLRRTRVSVHGRPHWRDNAIAKRDSRRDSDYASGNGGWFWGNNWSSSDDDARAARKKDRRKYGHKDERKRRHHAQGYAYSAN